MKDTGEAVKKKQRSKISCPFIFNFPVHVVCVCDFLWPKEFPAQVLKGRQICENPDIIFLFFLVIDDVFVRRDLYEGVYKPDKNAFER